MAGKAILEDNISQYLIDKNKNNLKARLTQIQRLKTPERDIREVAVGILDRIFRVEDFGIKQLAGLFGSILKTPEAMAAPDYAKFEEMAGRAGGLVTPEVQLQLKQRLGVSSSPKVKIGYIAGPGMFEKYGPALVALQKLYGDQTRIVVVVKGSSGEREAQRKMVDALNKGLPSNQTLLYREDPVSAAAILRNKYEIQGLGVNRLDADLIRKILPDFDLSRSQAQVSRLVSNLPSLAELLAEFSVAFHHALESAA